MYSSVSQVDLNHSDGLGTTTHFYGGIFHCRRNQICSNTRFQANFQVACVKRSLCRVGVGEKVSMDIVFLVDTKIIQVRDSTLDFWKKAHVAEIEILTKYWTSSLCFPAPMHLGRCPQLVLS